MTAIQIVRVISPEVVAQVVDHLNQYIPVLGQDVSRYAQGRRRAWLQYEWDLKDKTFSKAPIQDERLWNFCLRQFPEADLGLIAYGPVGISLHRDDSYADFKACTINLGEVETWRYEIQRTTMDKNMPQQTAVVKDYPVQPGHVIHFNCKNRHAAINPAEDRWSINLWRVKNQYRAAFEAVKNQEV